MTNLLKVSNAYLSYPNISRSRRGGNRTGDLNREYALSDISFEIKQGEGLALVGLNGSGKSTLLRMLAGIYVPNRGSVQINSKTACLFNMGIGMQMDLSGRTNIRLIGMVNGLTRQEVENLTPEIIDFSGLESVIDKPVYTYSQGMAMRLCFATITSLKPQLLLLDEWIGAGDLEFREKAEKRLNEMVASSHGFVLASHNTNVIKRHCNSAMWLHEGVCKMIGPIDDVVEQFELQSSTNSAA